MDLPVLAGSVAGLLFAASALPMLVKAWRTRDVSSYSVGNLALACVGNVVYTLYVLDLPAGPVWAMHAFYTTTTTAMLVWYVRWRRPQPAGPGGGGTPRAVEPGLVDVGSELSPDLTHEPPTRHRASRASFGAWDG